MKKRIAEKLKNLLSSHFWRNVYLAYALAFAVCCIAFLMQKINIWETAISLGLLVFSFIPLVSGRK